MAWGKQARSMEVIREIRGKEPSVIGIRIRDKVDWGGEENRQYPWQDQAAGRIPRRDGGASGIHRTD